MACNSCSTSIDLHIHSTASDGTCTPAEILAMARDLGLAAIAITDHDTLEGTRAALDHGIPASLAFLTGVEISADPLPAFRGSGSFHILGYGFDCRDSDLNQMLDRLKVFRLKRNPTIIERLNALGIDITLDEVKADAGACQLGRPHIARVLVKKKAVADMDAAFDRYLGTGKPAYVEKVRVSCQEAIACIRRAGGVPVLAHPGLLPARPGPAVEKLVAELKEMGLMGIEAYYPRHSVSETAYFEKLATDRELLVTGGTDFHGAISPEIQMGTGKGGFSVPVTLYARIVGYCRS